MSGSASHSESHSERPSDEAARQCLERVVASRVFAGSPKLVQFLRFVVEETLAGRGDALKEYVIGVGALGRPAQFDPSSDSAVRVAARQLRFKLSEYFADEGRDDLVTLELPKGGYVPTFATRNVVSDAALSTNGVSKDSAANGTLNGSSGTATHDNHSEVVHIASRNRRRAGIAALALLAAAAVVVATRAFDKSRASAASASALQITPAAGAEQSGIPSIIVLPFLNLSGSPDEEYVSDGIAEEITASLARSNRLRVIARTSAFRYKGKPQDVRTIARDVSANVVLEGSLRKSGDKYRVTTQLIDARDGVHLWTANYDVSRTDLFKVYDDISRAVALEINARVGGQIRIAASRYASSDPVAHALYLEARYNWNRRTPAALKRSVELFNQAIARDDKYALAYAGLADSYATMAANNITPPGESPPKAIAAARRALEIDSTLGEPHAAIALMRAFQDWDWKGADVEFAKAIELSPNYPTAHSWYAITLVARGRFDDALNQLQRAQALDPLSTAIAYNIAEAMYYARRYADSETGIQRILELEPAFPPAFTLLGRVLVQTNRRTQAREALVKAADTLAIAELTDTSNAYAMLRSRMQRFTAQEKSTFPYWMGVLYATMGENDSAFTWFNRAYDVRHLNIVSLKTEPTIDGIRRDARYTALLRRMRLDDSGLANSNN